MYRKAGNFELRDISVHIVVEAIGENEIFEESLYDNMCSLWKTKNIES